MEHLQEKHSGQKRLCCQLDDDDDNVNVQDEMAKTMPEPGPQEPPIKKQKCLVSAPKAPLSPSLPVPLSLQLPYNNNSRPSQQRPDLSLLIYDIATNSSFVQRNTRFKNGDFLDFKGTLPTSSSSSVPWKKPPLLRPPPIHTLYTLAVFMLQFASYGFTAQPASSVMKSAPITTRSFSSVWVCARESPILPNAAPRETPTPVSCEIIDCGDTHNFFEFVHVRTHGRYLSNCDQDILKALCAHGTHLGPEIGIEKVVPVPSIWHQTLPETDLLSVCAKLDAFGDVYRDVIALIAIMSPGTVHRTYKSVIVEQIAQSRRVVYALLSAIAYFIPLARDYAWNFSKYSPLVPFVRIITANPFQALPSPLATTFPVPLPTLLETTLTTATTTSTTTTTVSCEKEPITTTILASGVVGEGSIVILDG